MDVEVYPLRRQRLSIFVSNHGVDPITQARCPPGRQVPHLRGVRIENSGIDVDARLAVETNANVAPELRRLIADERPFLDSPPLDADHLIRDADLTHTMGDRPAQGILVSIGEVGN